MPQKCCGKFEPSEQGARVLSTTDRQKTDRQTDDSYTTDRQVKAYGEREGEFTFAKNNAIRSM